ncbi:MAG: SRPBCC family protein [Rhodospirillaceae bacterium]|jgi:uncharacterized protein YndB with AHSA1/START domain|nr:SRPBCC family protein [Rhodospirillaceae bacterium]
MADTSSFEHVYDVLIDAPAQAVFDYVTNPNSWPEWLVASHHIESPDRPLTKGETFRELWHTHKGEAELNWVITACDRPTLWIGETGTAFLGPIIVRYDFEERGGQTRYVRTVTNPERPKPPAQDMTQRMDDEAAIGLGNVKRIIEERLG